MKHVAPVRKQLGFRTIFNLLGPLTNPAGATYQVIGTTRTRVAEMLAQALFELGSQRALVVCGNDELDEVSLWGDTAVFEVSGTGVVRHTWNAGLLGLSECRVESLRVSGAAQSADVIRRVFAGERGPSPFKRPFPWRKPRVIRVPRQRSASDLKAGQANHEITYGKHQRINLPCG